ncbi:MAG: TRAP transporter small permease subunit [Proteobacteria bacterium]|nr:TRAP transporter small permease subunit [Pseudomonadota bacterium]
MLLWRKIEKISDSLERILKISIICSLGAIAFFVNLAVFFRYVLAAPLTWSTEISSYLLVYTVLFGASIALRHNQFVKVEAVANLLPPRLRTAVAVGSQFLIVVFLVLCIQSPSLLIQKAVITKTISPAIGIPMSHLYRLFRLGFALMLFFVCVNVVKLILSQPPEQKIREKNK